MTYAHFLLERLQSLLRQPPQDLRPVVQENKVEFCNTKWIPPHKIVSMNWIEFQTLQEEGGGGGASDRGNAGWDGQDVQGPEEGAGQDRDGEEEEEMNRRLKSCSLGK